MMVLFEWVPARDYRLGLWWFCSGGCLPEIIVLDCDGFVLVGACPRLSSWIVVVLLWWVDPEKITLGDLKREYS